MDPADLDRLLDQELRQLPQPRAPHSLLPRVLEAAALEQKRAAVATGWFTWPRAWQAASVAVVLAFCAAAAWMVLAPPASVAGTAREAGQLMTVMRLLWEALLEPAAAYLFVIGVALTLACAAAWAAFEVALGGASQR